MALDYAYIFYTPLYGAEAKFYTNNIDINKFAETSVENLYAVGDCTSKSRGQVASSSMGLMAAEGILANAIIRKKY